MQEMRNTNSVADRVDEIEDLIAQNKMTRAQVFTQMKQLMLYTRADINKIKAEAVQSWADQANPQNESEDRMINDAYDYANKLENKK